jgi:glyoxylase-like metal-dependent hydrolase (beta-lactamase superfamily II)
MAKAFASQADLSVKKATFAELAPGVYGYTTEGDPNTGVVIGDDGVLVIDARATPVLARELMDVIRTVTDKPIKYVMLTHYHAVRVMGASAYNAQFIISSEITRELIAERGQQDFDSEVQRFPRLFQAVETVPGLTWPNLTFATEMKLWMGKREVHFMRVGAGHTKGDAIVWLPKEKVLFSGDLVEWGATPYCGDAHFQEWPHTLERLRALKPEKLVPGRGDALLSAADADKAIMATQNFLRLTYERAAAGVKAGKALGAVYKETYDALAPTCKGWAIFDHCMPFNVSRALDEASGIDHPRIWTAERDIEMWKSLEG